LQVELTKLEKHRLTYLRVTSGEIKLNLILRTRLYGVTLQQLSAKVGANRAFEAGRFVMKGADFNHGGPTLQSPRLEILLPRAMTARFMCAMLQLFCWGGQQWAAQCNEAGRRSDPRPWFRWPLPAPGTNAVVISGIIEGGAAQGEVIRRISTSSHPQLTRGQQGQ
jgi:hypothetical protein